jgi:hypothetical protein
VGQALVGGVAALTVVHGTASIVRSRLGRAADRRRAAKAAAAAAATTTTEVRLNTIRAGVADRPDSGGPTGPEAS